jgi:hypothetical protein
LKVTTTSVDCAEKGVGLPPPNWIVPCVLENVGSVVHSENTEPVFDTETTDNFDVSNVRVASTAFTFFPCGLTRTVALNVCPFVYVPVAGDIRVSAAYVYVGAIRKSNATLKAPIIGA